MRVCVCAFVCLTVSGPYPPKGPLSLTAKLLSALTAKERKGTFRGSPIRVAAASLPSFDDVDATAIIRSTTNKQRKAELPKGMLAPNRAEVRSLRFLRCCCAVIDVLSVGCDACLCAPEKCAGASCRMP